MRRCYLLVFPLWVLAGCGAPETPPAPPAAKFDGRDSERTFRWLLETVKPIGEEKEAMSRRQYANPLNADYDAEAKAIEAKWAAVRAKLMGQAVVWPAIVRGISEKGIVVDGWQSGWDKGGESYHQYLSFEDGPTHRPEHGGFLALAKCVTLEDARKLLPGNWIYVSGIISKVEASLGQDGYLSVDVGDCKVHLVESTTAGR